MPIVRSSRRSRSDRAVSRAGAVLLTLGLVGTSAVAPAQAAVTTYDPFEVNQGFTWVATGDLALGNGELEGSAAAWGSLSSTIGNYPVLHTSADVPDYTVPSIDGDPVRLLGNDFSGSGGIDLTNRDDTGTIDPDSDEATAIAKFADTADLSGQERGSGFTRVTNPTGGILDLETLAWDPATWRDRVTTNRPAVEDYFPDADEQIDRTNQCLAQMYTDPALANEVTVTGDAGLVTLSGFDFTKPNYVYYDDIAGAVIKPGGEGYVPTAQAPFVVKVTDPTTTIGPINVEGWSANADEQQSYARYIMLDLSEVTGPVTIDGLEMGAVWAPGVDLVFTGSRSTNGQWFADDVVTTGGGEIHHHTFLGQLLCDDDAPAIDSSVAVTDPDGGALPQGGGTVVDTITYSGLTPGQEYVVDGALVTAAGGTDTGITGSTTFTPTEPDGTVDVTFTVSAQDAVTYAGQDLVAFQVLTLDGDVVATHEDVDDAEQTFPVADLTPATFTVVKQVDGSGAAQVPPDTVFTVSFEVTAGPSAGQTGQLEVPADGTAVTWPGDLYAGDVITFDEDGVEVDGVVFSGVTIDPESITLAEDVVPVVTVTNTYDLGPATFQIHKEIVGDGAALVPDDTEFTVDYEVTSGADAGTTGTLTIPADGTVVDGPELTVGDVVAFSEPTFPAVDDVIWGAPAIVPDPLVLTAGETVDVAVVNTAALENRIATGFSVLKVVSGTGAALVPDDAEFTVQWEIMDGPSAPDSGQLVVTADGSATNGPQDLQDGDVVRITEVDPPDVPGVDFSGLTVTPDTVVIDSSEPAAAQFTATNTYDLATATFQAHKEVTGSGADLVPDDATFDLRYEVTDGPSTGATGTLGLPADGTVVDGPDLLQGDVVTFSEDTPPDVDGVEWGDVTIDPETLTLDATTGVVDVTVTNTAEVAPTLDSEIVVTDTGGKTLPADGGTLTDTLTYTGLVPGQEYTIHGVLRTAGGERTALRGATTFTPAQPDGQVQVEFTLNAADVADYAGRDLVAFQWLTLDGRFVAAHVDLDDADQTFSVADVPAPRIDSAVAVVGSGSGVVGRDGATVVDTISYTGLVPGAAYRVTGELVVAPTAIETGITGSTRFTPNSPDGTVEVEFELTDTDAAEFAGDRLVAFQVLTRAGEEVASHENVRDADQSFTVAPQAPTIRTSASVVGSGDSRVVPPEGATVVDTITYTGLTPGVEYVVSGSTMHTDLSGTGVVGGVRFTPTAPDGSVEVAYEVTAAEAAEHPGEYQVVFEGLYVDDDLVATHSDIDDAAQTFWIAEGDTPDGGGSLPVTGPQSVAILLGLAGAFLLGGFGLRAVRRRTLG
ncbi:VaFE repeat-containing surface-anchored protein [Isoptericola aurantiacus]|uniref:VaFE repeat-containing surface-anchored protein n=1 Tax=Isoptericola aurantiacus TaxID=3377839 RepID=UPI00383AE9F2